MRGINVADVNDGLCMAVYTIPGKVMQIDCGGQNGELAFDGLNRINALYSPDIFVLSHFHIDHYNGLLYASLDSLKRGAFGIEEVYYPRIPEFREKETFLECLFSMNLRVFGSETGVMEYDFLEAIRRINDRTPFKRPLSSGDIMNIGGSVFEVLWPPAVIDDRRTLTVIKRALMDFEKALKADEETKKLHDHVKEEGIFRAYLGEQDKKKEFKEYRDRYMDAKWTKRRLPTVVEKANESLRKAANHLSLAFFEDNRLLFLGDAENYEIRQIVNDLKSKGRSNFYILITPHHGTHWDNSLRNIKFIYSITSNGSKMCSKMKTRFKEVSKRSLATFVNGDIIIPAYVTKGFWGAPLWYFYE